MTKILVVLLSLILLTMGQTVKVCEICKQCVDCSPDVMTDSYIDEIHALL